MMFKVSKGYIAQICDVHLQYGISTTKWPFYTFFKWIPLYYILFSLIITQGIHSISFYVPGKVSTSQGKHGTVQIQTIWGKWDCTPGELSLFSEIYVFYMSSIEGIFWGNFEA